MAWHIHIGYHITITTPSDMSAAFHCEDGLGDCLLNGGAASGGGGRRFSRGKPQKGYFGRQPKWLDFNPSDGYFN
jgi:hypothetical protein